MTSQRVPAVDATRALFEMFNLKFSLITDLKLLSYSYKRRLKGAIFDVVLLGNIVSYLLYKAES